MEVCVKVPKSLKIGGFNIDIRYAAAPLTHGTFDSEKLIIELCESNNDQRMGSTLVHEIIEVINDLNELDLDHGKITILGNQLYQILKDNKLVF
jgi:hypothetical protein